MPAKIGGLLLKKMGLALNFVYHLKKKIHKTSQEIEVGIWEYSKMCNSLEVQCCYSSFLTS